MSAELTAFFLVTALILYCILAGADYGAGMIEAFLSPQDREEQEKIVSRALGPVWEANHVWLVIAVVILFVGFPKAYTAISVHLHIPITAMLIGIILRGCAFTFRHYDIEEGESRTWYTRIFIFSSFITPFTLGVIAASLVGVFKEDPLASEPTFFAQYIHPWLNVFGASLGFFTCLLFAFLASVYLLGEVLDPPVIQRLRQQARILNILALFGGALVFITAHNAGLELIGLFLKNFWSLASLLAATLCLPALWFCIHRNHYLLARFFAAAQVALILLGWVALQAPNLYVENHELISIFSGGAPKATLVALNSALIVGACLIFPALIYLLIIFKSEGPRS